MSLKFAFSTLACPNWSVKQVIANALTMGYDGIEWRLLDGEIIDPVRDYTKVINAVAACRESGLDVCALDTSCSFNHADPEVRAKQIADLLNWILLAQKVRVPILRVFGGAGQQNGSPQPSQDVVNAWLADALRFVASKAEHTSVTIALETHDAFSSAHRVASVLQAINSSRVAALWDSHHPYRVGETVEDVVDALQGRIAHVHVKDARRNPTNHTSWQLTLLGEGEVPVREQLHALIQRAYTGYVSVEWEKYWHPELAEPEIALPQHIAWLRQCVHGC
ncbi:MAG: TIM barrel protein [Ktedonobacteraceae bacterium]